MSNIQKTYFQSLHEKLEPLIEDQTIGCVISDRISVDGLPIGIMYRDFPISDVPDSGWVFLAGDEDEKYMCAPQNHTVFTLNTICNYDSSIIPLIDAEYETAFIRNDNGVFMLDEHFFDIED
ncbi:MAG: DUF2185 domain-containing protein [Christensenella sp.]